MNGAAKAALRAALESVSARATSFSHPGAKVEAAGVVAMVISSRPASAFMPAADVQFALSLTGEVFSLTAPQLLSASLAAESLRSAPSKILLSMAPEAAPEYAEFLSEAAAYAASVPPVDLEAVSAAAMVRASQLRAVALPSAHAAGKNQQAAAPAAAAAATPAVKQEPTETLEELFARLDGLTGLRSIKHKVRQQAELLRVERLRAASSLKTPEVTRHLVFTGNPGTGKTTVARLVGKIYHALGLLPSDTFVEVDKSGLVAGYLGQSEEKTAKVIQSALGGVLFIDEAYSLTGDEYASSVTDTLVKAAEDHRDDLVIILAGYTGPMEDFIASNPGLASRFATVMEFPDYSNDELVEIFASLAAASQYSLEDGMLAEVKDIVSAQPRTQSFGNARFVRSLFEQCLLAHSWRLRDIPSPTPSELSDLTSEDLRPPASSLDLPPVHATPESGTVSEDSNLQESPVGVSMKE